MSINIYTSRNYKQLNIRSRWEKYLGAIGGGTEEAEGSSRADGAEKLLSDFGKIHAASLGEEQRAQEQKSR